MLPFADQLRRRLDDLAPQLAALGHDERAADAMRKLLATELPGLIDGYRAVPVALSARRRADGGSADADLLAGLELIDGEVARMAERLARGALDEVGDLGTLICS